MTIGSDLVEFVSNIHERGVFENYSLFMVIIVMFCLSSFQFSFIFGSTIKNPLTKIALNRKSLVKRSAIFLFYATFSTELWYILMGLLLQDFPFFIIRLVLLSSHLLRKNYSAYFYVTKNAIFCVFRVYRMISILFEERRRINGGK